MVVGGALRELLLLLLQHVVLGVRKVRHVERVVLLGRRLLLVHLVGGGDVRRALRVWGSVVHHVVLACRGVHVGLGLRRVHQLWGAHLKLTLHLVGAFNLRHPFERFLPRWLLSGTSARPAVALGVLEETCGAASAFSLPIRSYSIALRRFEA